MRLPTNKLRVLWLRQYVMYFLGESHLRYLCWKGIVWLRRYSGKVSVRVICEGSWLLHNLNYSWFHRKHKAIATSTSAHAFVLGLLGLFRVLLRVWNTLGATYLSFATLRKQEASRLVVGAILFAKFLACRLVQFRVHLVLLIGSLLTWSSCVSFLQWLR